MKVDCKDCQCYFRNHCTRCLEKNSNTMILYYYNFIERIFKQAQAIVLHSLEQNSNNNCYGFVSKHYKEIS